MMRVQILDAHLGAEKIFLALSVDGIVGFHGGRVSTRRHLRELGAMIDEAGADWLVAIETINHPETELAFGFDSTRFSRSEARNIVISAYEEKRGPDVEIMRDRGF